MKYLKSWKLFEFKETESNTPVLYKDDNLEVKVVKTFDACKEQGKDTSWCSNNLSLFYKHNMTANMFRFNFKDGYKLRLTWDYINHKASRDQVVKLMVSRYTTITLDQKMNQSRSYLIIIRMTRDKKWSIV